MADRFRDWTTIVYPDSAVSNWIDLLKAQHLCFLVSPLHEADPDGDIEEFKPHWHLYLKFGGVKTYQQVVDYLSGFSHAAVFNVKDPSGLIRYFFHADDPDKTQYDVDQAFMYGGFERFVTDAFGITKEQANEIMNEIQDWIADYQVSEYEVLWNHSKDIPIWRYVLNMYSCMSVNRLLSSIRGKKAAKEKAKDSNNGC